MLLPALSKAKDNAKRVKCLNNLKQSGLAYEIYASDSDGVIPISWYKSKTTQRSGMDCLRTANYVALTDSVLCPSWPPYKAVIVGGVMSASFGVLRPQGTPYSTGTDTFTRTKDANENNWESYHPWKMRSPANFSLLCDTSKTNGQNQERWYSAHTKGDCPHFRHGGNLCNSYFVDGHAESCTIDRFVEAYRRGMISAGSHALYLFIGIGLALDENTGLRKL